MSSAASSSCSRSPRSRPSFDRLQVNRILRSTLVSLALPGLVALVFLTNAYYKRDGASRHGISNDVASASKWTDEQAKRDECWAQWFSSGSVCHHPPQSWLRQDKLDLIWTWSNASLASTHVDSINSSSSSDLLRYSFRSAQKHLQSGFGTVTLLTPDAPTGHSTSCTVAYQDETGQTHAGQRPCWLATSHPVYQPPKLLHHRQVACADTSRMSKDVCSDPSINNPSASASTASWLAAQSTDVSNVRLVMAPHHILAADVSSSDFWSPLYGTAFRISDDPLDNIPDATLSAVTAMLNSSSSSSKNSSSTHDAPLVRAGELLNHRFGVRPRRRLLDLPQPISHDVIEELRHIWPKELSQPNNDVDLATLHAYYMAERYHEALLWSFLVAKHDRDGDGVYSAQEAEALLQDLGVKDAKYPSFPSVHTPIRGSCDNSNMAHNLDLAGQHARLSPQSVMGSMDGFAAYQPRSPPTSISSNSPAAAVAAIAENQVEDKDPGPQICQLNPGCFPSLLTDTSSTVKPSVAQLFSHITHKSYGCGDCMLFHLVAQSGLEGLSAFLPSPDLLMSPLTTLPLTSTFEDNDVSIKPSSDKASVRRLDVVTALLSRYAHSFILEEPSVAPMLANRKTTTRTLIELEFFNRSSVFSFKQHGPPSVPGHEEDAWIWTKYLRAWLSLKYPFAMRFEARTAQM